MLQETPLKGGIMAYSIDGNTYCLQLQNTIIVVLLMQCDVGARLVKECDFLLILDNTVRTVVIVLYS